MAQSDTDENAGRWTRKAIAKQLSDLYYEAGDPGSYGGVERLYQRAKSIGIPVTRDDVARYLSMELPYSIHKPVRHTFVRNHTYVGHIDQQWQADLADMQGLVAHNDNYNYILTVIDILSRFAWAVPVRSKSTKDMVVAFNRLFKEAKPRVPQRLQTDNGKEFFNKEVSALLRSKGIHHFASHSDQKASVVERFNRTLKTRMWVYFTANNTKRYVNVLPDIVYAYNHSPHRSIRMEPADVVGDEAATRAWRNLFYKDTCKSRIPKIVEDGQRARISRWKGEFEKGYEPNWSRETFAVQKALEHPYPVYNLVDAMGEPVEGKFYEKELQPIPRSTLQVERVIRTRKRGRQKESLVKWLGWEDKFNRWISAEQLAKYRRSPADRARDVSS